MFGFLWRLLISPASLETLPEASVTSLPPLVPCLVPRTKALAGSQDLAIGQGLAASETQQSWVFWVNGKDREVLLGQRPCLRKAAVMSWARSKGLEKQLGHREPDS